MCFIAVVGISSIVITSVVFFIFSFGEISESFSFPKNSFTFLLITSSLPTKHISDSTSATAFTAPLITASGALSPPIASINIVKIIPPLFTQYDTIIVFAFS